MFSVIKTSKFDNLFKRLFIVNFLIYAFSLEIVESTLFDIRVVSLVIGLIIKLTFAIVILICAYNFFRGFYNIKELIILSIASLVIIATYLINHSSLFLVTLIYIYAAKNIDIRMLIKWTMIVLSISYVLIILCRVLGISQEYIITHVRYGVERKRYSFGFNYTCIGSIYLLFITLMYIYIRGDKFNNLDAFVITVLNIIVFILTDTKSNFICIILEVFLVYLFKYNKNKVLYKLFSYFAIMAPIIGTIIISVFTFMYGKGIGFFVRINSLLTGRLRLTYDALMKYGIGLFGKEVHFFGRITENNVYNYVDSAYIQLLIQYGALCFILMLALLIFIAYKAYQNNEKWLLLVLFVVYYHAVFDDRLIAVTIIPYVLLFLTYLPNSDKKYIS